VTRSQVRDGTEDDIAQIATYDPVVGGGDLQRLGELQSAANAGFLRVAIDAGSVVGHSVTRPKVFFGFDFLDLLHVRKESRRCGIGRLLLAHAQRAATTDKLWTSTNLSNAPMQALLLGQGWTAAGIVIVGLDPGDPEVFYFAARL
jgi:GNAT superfamily N-acetyltransferase